MGEAFFDEVAEPIHFEGLESSNPFAFKVYDKDRMVLGKRMARSCTSTRHLRFR